MTAQPRPAASLDEMRRLLAALPAPEATMDGAMPDPVSAPVRRLAETQGRFPPRLDRPRVALFAAAHGVSAHLPKAAGPDLGGRIEAILERRAPIIDAAAAIDADLRLYEMAWPRPSGDITTEPALGDGACATAMAYGMMAVDDTVDILCLSALGADGAIAAAALGLALFGGRAEAWAEPAAAALVEAAFDRHVAPDADPLEILRRLGGEDIAAIAGAILAARYARIPVVLDGVAALAAAGVLHRATARATDHCVATGAGDTPGEQRFVVTLGLPLAPVAVAGDAGLAAIAGLRAALARPFATS